MENIARFRLATDADKALDTYDHTKLSRYQHVSDMGHPAIRDAQAHATSRQSTRTGSRWCNA